MDRGFAFSCRVAKYNTKMLAANTRKTNSWADKLVKAYNKPMRLRLDGDDEWLEVSGASGLAYLKGLSKP